jgi:hypothetical protein
MKDTGGPAFPFVFDDMATRSRQIYTGMSIRDWFAGMAMQGLLACPVQPQSGPDMYARDAYTLADAMLKERSKG